MGAALGGTVLIGLGRSADKAGMKTKKLSRPFWKRPTKTAGTKRTIEDIQLDYDRACLEAGDLQYKVAAMTDRMAELNRLRLNLNRERAAMVNAASQAPLPPIAPETQTDESLEQ